MNKYLFKKAFCDSYKRNSYRNSRGGPMRSQEPFKTTKFAILLSGCGNKDGSEIIEAATCMTGLSRRHAEIQCFSIDRDQFDVVNHRDGSTTQEKRNMFVESSRIARGNLKEIKDLNAKDFDGLVIPGGFGIAKNFSDFATKGADMKVDEQVEKVILDFYNSNKVIGACCIAPILLARIFGNKFGGPGLTITLGREGVFILFINSQNRLTPRLLE
jgi:enhancing lycopene biosynthesis protein 2